MSRSRSLGGRKAWDDRHHLVFGRENAIHPKGQRDYFDRPRELRIVCPEGHDGLATPYELRPSLHWLKYHESPKMSRRAVGDRSRSSGGLDGSLMNSKGMESVDSVPSLPPASSMPNLERLSRTHTGVGSPPGSPTKPRFQKTGSWYLHPHTTTDAEKRKIKFTSTHYSEKHGTVKNVRTGSQVPWNNRWHLTPSRFGSKLHHAYQEYFDLPSRMYTSASEDWRHMYGTDCEKWANRPPGSPLEMDHRYGWKGLVEFRDVAGLSTRGSTAGTDPMAQTM